MTWCCPKKHRVALQKVPWIRDMTHLCAIWLAYMCDVTHMNESRHGKLWRVMRCGKSTAHVIWRTHVNASHIWMRTQNSAVRMCRGSHAYVWHDSFICDMISLCVWHDWFVRVIWLVRVCFVGRAMSRVNESRHTYGGGMSHMEEACHIWMRHVTYEWGMSHMNESRHRNEWGMSHMKESRHTCVWGM